MGRVHVRLLGTQVFEALREDIITGRLSPGHRLKEMAIAAQMGTSQGPVREALRRLEEEGLVKSVPHVGSFVTGWDIAEMREVYEIRAVIEGLSAARAVWGLTPEDFSQLETLLDTLVDTAARDDPEGIARADLAFHAHVIRRAEHSVLIRLFQTLEAHILRCAFMTRTLTGAYPPERARAEHRTLIDALRTGDPRAASEAFRAHISWDVIEGRLVRDVNAGQAALGRKIVSEDSSSRGVQEGASA